VLDRREQLHSGRLFEHLHATGATVTHWLDIATSAFTQRGGVSAVQAHDMATKLLAEVSARQGATLAYADVFLFMAAIGLVALCFVPLMSPTPVVRK
jgi:DHA2 family multidrug resistance protein